MRAATCCSAVPPGKGNLRLCPPGVADKSPAARRDGTRSSPFRPLAHCRRILHRCRPGVADKSPAVIARAGHTYAPYGRPGVRAVICCSAVLPGKGDLRLCPPGVADKSPAARRDGTRSSPFRPLAHSLAAGGHMTSIDGVWRGLRRDIPASAYDTSAPCRMPSPRCDADPQPGPETSGQASSTPRPASQPASAPSSARAERRRHRGPARVRASCRGLHAAMRRARSCRRVCPCVSGSLWSGVGSSWLGRSSSAEAGDCGLAGGCGDAAVRAGAATAARAPRARMRVVSPMAPASHQS